MPHPKPMCEFCIEQATRLLPQRQLGALPKWRVVCENHASTWYDEPGDLEELGPGFLLVYDAKVQIEEWRNKRV